MINAELQIDLYIKKKGILGINISADDDVENELQDWHLASLLRLSLKADHFYFITENLVLRSSYTQARKFVRAPGWRRDKSTRFQVRRHGRSN